MSSTEYVPLKYATVEDFLEELGLTDVQQKAVTEQQRNRYQTWISKGRMKVEAIVSDVSPLIKIAENTPEYTHAHDAVINWAMYEKKKKDGSPVLADFKNDFKDSINEVRKILIRNRGDRVKNVAIEGKKFPKDKILLPSQIDTAFY